MTTFQDDVERVGELLEREAEMAEGFMEIRERD